MELLPLALLLNIPATAAKLSSHVSWTWNIKKLPISFLHIWQDEYSEKKIRDGWRTGEIKNQSKFNHINTKFTVNRKICII